MKTPTLPALLCVSLAFAGACTAADDDDATTSSTAADANTVSEADDANTTSTAGEDTTASDEDDPTPIQWADWVRTHFAYGAEPEVQHHAAQPARLLCEDLSSPGLAFYAYPAARVEQLRQRLEADGDGFRHSCEQLVYESWEVEARVASPDRERFAAVTVRVRPAPAGKTGAELLVLAESVGVQTSKAGQIIVPVGAVLVTLDVPCSAGDLFVYEAGDLLAALDAGTPGGAPGGTVVFSPCGQMFLDLRAAGEVRADAAETRTFWGRPFPAARDELRASWAASP